jgi:hypothetical protein
MPRTIPVTAADSRPVGEHHRAVLAIVPLPRHIPIIPPTFHPTDGPNDTLLIGVTGCEVDYQSESVRRLFEGQQTGY